MGRQTSVLHTQLFDSDQGEHPLVPSQKFIDEMNKKYKLEYRWHFDPEDGEITFGTKEPFGNRMCGEPEDHIKALLETAKKYKRRINGSFSFDDDTTGGSYHGLVYIAADNTAMVNLFNTDLELDTLNNLSGAPLRSIVRL